MNYTITYSVVVDDDDHSSTVTVDNTGMSDSAARQYAANHLFDTTDVTPADIDVHAIDVMYVATDR